MAVLPAACLVELIRAEADLVFELDFLWFARRGRWRFLRGFAFMGKLRGGKYAVKASVNGPRLVQ